MDDLPLSSLFARYDFQLIFLICIRRGKVCNHRRYEPYFLEWKGLDENTIRKIRSCQRNIRHLRAGQIHSSGRQKYLDIPGWVGMELIRNQYSQFEIFGLWKR